MGIHFILQHTHKCTHAPHTNTLPQTYTHTHSHAKIQVW